MVREIQPPAAAADLAGLATIDYRESFAFTGTARRRPEQWARVILEGASRRERLTMLSAWLALGVGLAPLGSAGQVLGWRIRHDEPDAIVLGVRAAVGLTARIVILVDATRVTHTMLVRYDRGLGARLWARAAPGHRRFLTGLLERAAGMP